MGAGGKDATDSEQVVLITERLLKCEETAL